MSDEYDHAGALRSGWATPSEVMNEADRIDTDARRIAELEGEVERLAKVLKSIPTLDKTPEYEYGEPDRNGNKPGSGKRWKTPAESSRDALRLLKEATDAE